MGTNTFHLIIVKVKKDNFKIVYREKTAVKIGQRGINHGVITDDAIDRALKTLTKFKEVIDEENVEQVFATATSAIRNARNGQELVTLIEKETAIKTRIISGIQEAEYIYFGVNEALLIGSKPTLIMDIGGGSIEFIIATSDKIYWRQSFEIGGQRMVEKFQKHDPMQAEDQKALLAYIESNLEELFKACETFAPKTLIGSSGTFDTLSDIYSLKAGIERPKEATEYPLTMEAFREIYLELIAKNKEERLAIPGMIALRVDMITVACELVNFVINKLALEHIRVSGYALKEGVLLSTLHSLEQEETL